MADERDERTEYNWSYSGDDAQNYRSKYTQSFDPNYAKYSGEREDRQEEAMRRKAAEERMRQRPQQRKHPSARRARLYAQQDHLVTEETEPASREARASGRTKTAGEKHSAESPSKRSSAGTSGKKEPGQKNTAQKYAPQKTAGTKESRQRKKAARPVNKQSSGYKRQMALRRFLILVIAVAVFIVLILILANKYSLTIRMEGDDPLYLEVGQTYQDPGATAAYKGTLLHFRDTDVPVTMEQNINSSVCGSYEVTYRAEYRDQTATATRMVIVPDRVPPVLTLDDSVNVVKRGEEWKDSFTATDDQDGDITANVEILGEVNMRRDGKYDLTYRVQDSAGNEATATRTVLVSSVAINRPETAKQGDENVIYLTFDGGPGMYTERLLDILDNHNVKATFFVTDTSPANRDLIGEEYRRGHTVGVMGLTDDLPTIYENGNAYLQTLDQEIAIIEEQTGMKPSFVRLPDGSYNDWITLDPELRRTIAAGLKSRGLRYVDWTIDSYDTNSEYLAEDLYWNMVDPSSMSGIKMILCHDQRRDTVEAVDDYLSWAIENHYVFLPVNAQTPVVHFEELE